MRQLVIAARLASLLLAQQPPAFDVSVIKPADPANGRMGMGFGPNGRSVTIAGLTLLGIVRLAYGVFPEPVNIAPAMPGSCWIDAQRFDITAKSEGDTPVAKAESNLMLQQLLAARFGLRIHRETKEITVYSLLVGKSGAKLVEGGTAGPYLSGPAPGKLVGTRASMASLVNSLGGQLGRPVIDDTGLRGAYDFTLTWASDHADPTRPSLFTAVEDRLGLKLESKKAPVEVIVLAHAEKPSEN